MVWLGSCRVLLSALIHHQPRLGDEDVLLWASAISHIGYTTWECSRMYQEEKAPILKRSHGTALSVVPNVENHAFYIFGRITSSHDAITLENHVWIASRPACWCFLSMVIK